ncbi:7657_t:CDS:2, partial [Dentiscutata heterogama]
KAKQIANTLNIQNFAASNRWLQGFKKQYYIVYTINHGEAVSTLVKKLPEFYLSLQNDIVNYNLVDVYNCAKTALYWLLESSKSLTHNRIAGVKKPKNQSTLKYS